MAFFADQETALHESMRPKNLVPMLTDATVKQVTSVILNLRYLPTSRGGQPPLPALARDRLRDVEKKAKRLAESIVTAIEDPLLELAYTEAFEGLHDIEMLLPPEWRELLMEERRLLPESSASKAKDVYEKIPDWHKHELAVIRLKLAEGLRSAGFIGGFAALGIGMLQGEQGKARQLKGRPPKAAGRLPALFFLITTQEYAPPPSNPRKIGRWRDAVVDFVLHLLVAANLPAADEEFIREHLPA